MLRRIVSGADVLVESFRPGVMDRLGAGYQTLSGPNPALVYCAISGYGQDGPYREMPGHDINYTGYGGVLSMIGPRGEPPVLPGVQIADMGAGMLGAVGILSALFERGITGRGTFIDVAMLDAAVSLLSIHAGAFLAFGETAPLAAMPLAGGYACYGLYRARDGKYLTVGALEARFWRALCTALGCQELIDEQFEPPHRQREMADRLQGLFETRDRDEWLALLRDVPGCVGPVNDLGEALADPQVRHRNLVATVGGRPVGPGPALRLWGRETPSLGPAPRLGEDTAQVLAEVGVEDAELIDLRAGGVV